MKPGDVVTGQSWTIGEQLAYQGKDDCASWRCTRRGSHQREDGTWELGVCVGWHCPKCDEPCSSHGHKCNAKQTA